MYVRITKTFPAVKSFKLQTIPLMIRVTEISHLSLVIAKSFVALEDALQITAVASSAAPVIQKTAVITIPPIPSISVPPLHLPAPLLFNGWLMVHRPVYNIL